MCLTHTSLSDCPQTDVFPSSGDGFNHRFRMDDALEVSKQPGIKLYPHTNWIHDDTPVVTLTYQWKIHQI